MIKQLEIGGKKSFDDFGMLIATRKISTPTKKSIIETVPFSNVIYDYSKVDGELYWNPRTLDYSFDIAELTTEEMEVVKSKFQSWILNVHDEDIYDPYIGDYHFHGSYSKDSWSEDFGAGTISVTFEVYPYKISNKDNSVVEELGLDETGVNNVTLENSGEGLIRSLKFDGASPNPDYPQEIKLIESVDVKSYSKNLVDFSKPYTITNAELTFENDVLTLSTEITKSYDGPRYDILELIKENAGKNLRLDFESITETNPISGTAIGTLNLKIDGANVYHTFIGKPSDDYEPTEAYYTIPNDVSNITSATLILFTNNSSTRTDVSNIVTITKPILHFGSEKTEYTRYKNFTKTIDLQDNFIGAIGDVKDKFRLAMVDGKPHLYLDKYIGKVVFNGSEIWNAYTSNSGDKVYATYINDYKKISGITCMCDKFIATTNSGYGVLVNGQCSLRYANDTHNLFYVCTNNFSTVDEFKNWLASNNVEVYYVLAEPYTIDLGIVEIPTYYNVTHLFVETGFDTNMEVAYDEGKLLTIVNNSSHRITPTITSEGNFTIKLNDVSYSVGEGVYNSGLHLEVGENNLIVGGSGKITFDYVEEIF